MPMPNRCSSFCSPLAHAAGLALLVSSPLAAAAPAVPGPPTQVTATRADGAAEVRWVEPPGVGADGLTDYDLEVAEGPDYATWLPAVVAASPACAGGPPAACTATVTGLGNGQRYKIQVRARTAGGVGPWAVMARWVSPEAPQAMPGVPGNLGGVAAPGALVASWTPPQTLGAGATGLVRYRVLALHDGQLAGYCQATGQPPPTTCTIHGLTAGTPYTLRVRSFNNLRKYSAPSAPAGPYTPGP